MGRTTSSGSKAGFENIWSKLSASESVSSSSSSSVIFMKLYCWGCMWRGVGEGLERPSKQARAFKRFDLRTRVETDEVALVTTERRRMAVSGAGVREMVRDGDDDDDDERDIFRGGIGRREGIRGGESA